MTQRREQRARRERISRAIADYRNFNLTIEAAAEQAGMTVDEFRSIVQGPQIGPYGCLCQTLAHRVTGDGCEICNPEQAEWYQQQQQLASDGEKGEV